MMQKMRELIESHDRWRELAVYIDRIETYREIDFSLVVENSKAMLESIGKEICKERGYPLEAASSINGVLKQTFRALGHANGHMVQKISASLANIGQQMGELRNEIGSTGHGHDMATLRERNNKVDKLTRDFLLDSTSAIAIFLIRVFEERHEQTKSAELSEHVSIEYDDAIDFNDSWDEAYGEFAMGEYSYTASEILFAVDRAAYASEYQTYQRDQLASDIYDDECVHFAKDGGE
jgi:hypothetical protein